MSPEQNHPPQTRQEPELQRTVFPLMTATTVTVFPPLPFTLGLNDTTVCVCVAAGPLRNHTIAPAVPFHNFSLHTSSEDVIIPLCRFRADMMF